MLKRKDGEYWRRKVEDNRGNSKKLWQTLAGIFSSKDGKSVTIQHTAEDFARFFSKKLEDIREETLSAKPPYIGNTASLTKHTFSTATRDEVIELLKKSLGKTCGLDPVPSRLIKQNAEVFAHFMTLLFNKSLAEGIFPDSFKRTTITPLLKRSDSMPRI